MYDEKAMDAAMKAMTGLDYIAAQNRYKTTHPAFVGVLQLEIEFQAELAAAALGENVNELKARPIREFVEICARVQRFLSANLEENATA